MFLEENNAGSFRNTGSLISKGRIQRFQQILIDLIIDHYPAST